jgi:TetR/AcrR family transcriptional regulator, regulator of cefoperazone and chloramphenicol sensitivity
MNDDTKQRLIDSAGEIFAAQGFAAASIREICRKAGANVAAVHYHFGDKEQLYLACLEQAQSCQAADAADPAAMQELPARERLRELVRGMLVSKLASGRPHWHLELMLREMGRPTEACADIVDRYIRPMSEVLWRIIAELRPDQAQDRHFWLTGFSVVSQVIFYYVHQPIVSRLMGEDAFGQLTVDELTDHITAFSLAALDHPGPYISPTTLPAGPVPEESTP